MNIFIVNPKAGNGKALNAAFIIKRICEEQKIEHRILMTEEKGSATIMAGIFSRAMPNSIIYSVGGDGTLNEVVNGIDSKKTKLCVIPAGSGNDFYRISKDLDGTKRISIGMVNERKFINIASLGLDAKIANRANIIKQATGSKTAYLKAICDQVVHYEPTKMCISGVNHNLTLLAICRGKYYGGGIPINPNYDLMNDCFDIYNVSEIKRLEFIKLFAKLYQGKHVNDPIVNYSTDNKISVSSSETLLCNVDGEIISGKNFDFSILKNDITITNDIHPNIKELIKIKK